MRGKTVELRDYMSTEGGTLAGRQSPRHSRALPDDSLWAEEFFSRLRRAEIGNHPHIAGQSLLRYAQEATWREDNRRVANGDQASPLSGLAANPKPPVGFSGDWQKHRAA